jgi:hypothetical protein
MKNIIRIISTFILILAFLCVFAFLVRHVSTGGTKLGVFTNALIKFSELPILVEDVFRESATSSRLVKADLNFQSFNHLDYDIYAINAQYDSSKWIISLSNLKNDSVKHRWYLHEEHFFRNTDRIFSHAAPPQPIILEDKSLIIQNSSTFNLYRIDRQSNIMWHNTDHLFHHSTNLDKDGNIWVCTSKIIKLSKYKDDKYLDDYITKIDVENGNTLYNKSVREIMLSNGLEYLVYGIGNQISVASHLLDPFHLNDIEPVLEDGPYWKSGDLFLSFRHRSMIILYRPSTNRILRVISGPFFNQHDVDILSDSTISLFNNNVSYGSITNATNNSISELRPLPNPEFNKTSNVLKYNFSDSTYTTIYLDQFISNEILTQTDGLHHILSNGDMFVESQNKGKVYIFNEKEVLLKEYFNPITDGYVEPPNWVRIYENISF